MALLWFTYWVIREHSLTGTCRGQSANPTEIFQQVAEQDRNALSIAFYKPRLVEVRELGYTILEDFANPANRQVFNDIDILFDQHEDRELNGRRRIDFFSVFSATLFQDCSAKWGWRSRLGSHL